MNATAEIPFTAKQIKTIQRVLDALDRWDDRLTDHYGRQRRHTRTTFRGLATVVIPSDAGFPPVTLQVVVRNVSPGGMAFVHSGQLMCEKLIVGLAAGSGSPSWFHADVKRARPVQDEYWEYGVAFRERASM